MKYDAAIIGAGADGLIAACVLARAGKHVLVIARGAAAGGRLVSRPFHPGFRASVFCDTVAEIPGQVLALLPPIALTPAIVPHIRARHTAALERIFEDAATPRSHGCLAALRRRTAPALPAWPGSDLAAMCLEDFPGGMAALAGRALDPRLAGSALAALTLPRMEPARGGLATLGAAFAAAATAAGVEIRLGLETSEVLLKHGRVAGLLLADGTRIEADAVISTLDFKQSILSLFAWRLLPEWLVARAGAFRMAGATARLLLALKKPAPCSGPVWLTGGADALAAWRRGVIARQPPLLVDPVSRRDPSLAPDGMSVMTVTLGAVPYRLFDGGWTHARRLELAARALGRVEAAWPGTIAALAAVEIVAPPDIEDALGLTNADLDGGVLAPDQMLALRPGVRTVLPGFYLGGVSTAAGPLGTGAAGFAAATALLADAPFAGSVLPGFRL